MLCAQNCGWLFDVWRPLDLDDFSNRRLSHLGGTLNTFLLILEKLGV